MRKKIVIIREIYFVYEGEIFMLYPLKLTAPLKDYLWGGTRLKTEYHKETALEKVAKMKISKTCIVPIMFPSI